MGRAPRAPAGGGAAGARARPPARGGHGPAPGAARADSLRLPSPSRPGKGDFCKLSRARGGDARAPGPGRGARCPRRPQSPSSSPRPLRRRGAAGGGGRRGAVGSGGLRRGFEVPAASAPALRGGGAWRPPRMPHTALRRLAPPGRRGRPAPGRGARAHAPESPPPEVGKPPGLRGVGALFIARGRRARVLGEGSVYPPGGWGASPVP